jgi:hypothetical protein
MDIFFVAAGPRYVRRRPGTTAGHGLSPALLLAAKKWAGPIKASGVTVD